MTPEERAEKLVAEHFPDVQGESFIAAAIRDAVAAEREKRLAVVEKVRAAYEMCVVARGDTSDGARVTGWLLNVVVGSRVATQGEPVPTADAIAARIREGGAA